MKKLKDIRDNSEKLRKEKERGSEILVKNFYELNIKKKILKLFVKNFDITIKKQINISMKIKNKKNLYLKKLFFYYISMYLEIEKDRIFLIYANVDKKRQVNQKI